MKGRNRGILTNLSILLILGIVVTIVFIRQNNLRDIAVKQNESKNDQQNEFINSISGYKFLYPAGWLVDSNDPTMVVLVSPKSSLVAGSPDYGNIISIGSSYLSHPATIENFFSFYSKNNNFKAVPYSVNGLAATNFVAITDKYKGTNFIALTKDGKVFIRFSYQGEDKYKSAYENLLSSFEFIDPNPAPSNSDHTYEYETIGGVQPNYSISEWATYLNNEFNFSCEYPRLWVQDEYKSNPDGSLLVIRFSPIFSSQRLHPPSYSLAVYSSKSNNINSYLNDQKFNIVSQENKLIGGQKGLVIVRKLKKSSIPIPPKKLWLVEKGNYLYVLSTGFSENNHNLWERILSSVKFLK